MKNNAHRHWFCRSLVMKSPDDLTQMWLTYRLITGRLVCIAVKQGTQPWRTITETEAYEIIGVPKEDTA